jgi:hypothetical protein
MTFGAVTYCHDDTSGVLAWMTEIEYTLFKPDTDANEGFHISTVRWPDDVPPPAGIYNVVTFEKRAQIFAESILWKNGLKKVALGFTQIVIGGGGKVEKFPLRGPNIFFLENHSKGAANVIYTNDPVKIRIAHEHEMKQCEPYFEDHKKWLETEREASPTPSGQASGRKS